MIQINYNNKVYAIKVLDVRPNFEEHSGISIVETDLEVQYFSSCQLKARELNVYHEQVDFAPPVGYVEPSQQRAPVGPTMV